MPDEILCLEVSVEGPCWNARITGSEGCRPGGGYAAVGGETAISGGDFLFLRVGMVEACCAAGKAVGVVRTDDLMSIMGFEVPPIFGGLDF